MIINPCIFLSIASYFYLMLIIIVYFSKKSMYTLENKIYKIILFLSFFCLTFEISSALLTAPYLLNIKIILKKLFMCSLLTWGLFFILYNFSISKNIQSISEIFKHNVFIILLLIVHFCTIVAIFVFDLKLNYNENGVLLNSYGYGQNIFSITLLGYAFIIFIILVKNYKNLKSKSYYPSIVFVILMIITGVIQSLFPSLVLANFVMSFIVILMYFTIENPDLQMLKEFHKAKEQAEESNREKTNFLFNISNEIKKPINNIIYTSENAINKQEISDIKNDLRAIKGDSNNLLSYVNNVLDISDEEIRQIEIKGSKYNSKRLFEIISKKYEPTLNKIEYRFKYDNSTPEYLYGDSMRIKQIVNILLENAREYTKQGYIELSVNSIVKNEICRLVITVEDSGTGMDTETIKHLFDKDKIYDDKLLKEIDDTKNNLSILKSIVNLMNGSVLVESTIGSGSKFTVILDQKISTEKTKIEEKVEEYEEMYEKDKKIILVTDNKEISTKIQKILKKQPYKLEIVTLGQTCLEQIRKGTEYDLIIIDEEIPKLNYEDTLNKIKETKCYKKPVLLITSNQIFGSKEMYQEKGFKDTIYKPIKKEELIHEIEEYINE